MAKDLKPFAVFDIDGTLIRWQLYHALTDKLAVDGRIEPKIYQKMLDARNAWKHRAGFSFHAYEMEVLPVYNTIVKTLSVDELDEAIDVVLEKYKDQTYTYTRDLLGELKGRGYLLFAISGSQTEIVTKIADYYNFDDSLGTIYERRGKGFSGAITHAPYHNKDRSLDILIARNKTSYEGSIGVGDSLSDAAMLKRVETAIAFNPDQALFKHAGKAGWKVVIERKNMIYELEKDSGKYQLVKTNAG